MPDSSNGLRRAVVDRVVVDELRDGLLRRQRSETFDLFGGRAEAGALDQVGGAVVAPVSRGNG